MRWSSVTIDNICCVYPCLFAGWCKFPDNDDALCECNLCIYFVDPFISIAVNIYVIKNLKKLILIGTRCAIINLTTYIESDFQTNLDCDGIRIWLSPPKRLRWPKCSSPISGRTMLILAQATWLSYCLWRIQVETMLNEKKKIPK